MRSSSTHDVDQHGKFQCILTLARMHQPIPMWSCQRGNNCLTLGRACNTSWLKTSEGSTEDCNWLHMNWQTRCWEKTLWLMLKKRQGEGTKDQEVCMNWIKWRSERRSLKPATKPACMDALENGRDLKEWWRCVLCRRWAHQFSTLCLCCKLH